MNTVSKNGSRWLPALGKHAALILLMAIWIVPVLSLLISSFRPAYDITNSGWWTAILPPYQFTLDNYESVMTRNGIGRNFLNSAAITIPVTLITVAVAAVAGYVFGRWKFAAREWLFVIVLALLSVPLQMTLVPVLQMFSNLGIVGTFPAVWIAHVGYALPFSIYLLRNFFANVPEELFESAAILLYLADQTGRLLPNEPTARWQAIQWLVFHAASVGPGARFFALNAVTNRHDVLDRLARRIGAAVLIGQEVKTARLGHLAREIMNLKAEERALRASAPFIRGK